ncbi:hypothetical protein E1267_22540 [Nonomuraea longispora]|uniref:Uncharacterized protein n=1 Tax=Nonomuraea longispora TaxID=1848320 RepID=A0A4R4N8V9_9ACTN|nr:hypothetical protein [Nonomuraea longispora]TDC04514.1 hypothetical protein E1267_22540 [Nonomuraea longispora]
MGKLTCFPLPFGLVVVIAGFLAVRDVNGRLRAAPVEAGEHVAPEAIAAKSGDRVRRAAVSRPVGGYVTTPFTMGPLSPPWYPPLLGLILATATATATATAVAVARALIVGVLTVFYLLTLLVVARDNLLMYMDERQGQISGFPCDQQSSRMLMRMGLVCSTVPSEAQSSAT